ncbi:MAG: response regulator, partial [Anaerolineae bacterium]|nr:response regulator [Anaerolineae bacterium]
MSYQSTILIVDDEPVMREILDGLLLNSDYNLAFASGGTEALDQAAKLRPDLILLDVMMPDMDGFEVCKRLRTDPLLAQVPVIMITALDDRESRLHGIKVGADDFVTKPFDAVELQTRVQTIVRLDRYRRLLLERSKFEWVVEQAADGYLLLNEKTDILYANAQARLYLGLPLDQVNVAAHRFLDLVQQQYSCEPQAAWANWPQQLTKGQSPLYLVRPETDHTNAFWLRVELMDVISHSQERYIVCLRDITTNVVARRIMWTFHDQVGHKLKTPMTLLTGFLELLQDNEAANMDSTPNPILASALKSAQRLQREIVSIIDYIQGHDVAKLGLIHCCLCDIKTIAEILRADLELESINISYTDLESPEEIFLPLSCQMFEQILWELCKNAKKFHPKQTPVLDIELSRVDEMVRVRVLDDGLSLSPDQLLKLWT